MNVPVHDRWVLLSVMACAVINPHLLTDPAGPQGMCNGICLIPFDIENVFPCLCLISLYLQRKAPPFTGRLHPLSLPLSLTACPYFCSFVIRASPCLTTSAYCLFLSSGLFVSMIPFTRSIMHGMRSAAMNLARSLRDRQHLNPHHQSIR